jgi:flagellar M-ring protein FliF
MQSEKKSETINYEISKVTSHIINSSGEIKRQSAVVLVDGIYTAQQGSAEKKYTPRSSEEISQFEDMVKKAIGFKAERGDEVRVVNMPFETNLQEDLSPQKREIIPFVIRLAKYIMPLIALVLVFLFVIKPLMKSLTSSPLTQPSQLSLPKTVSEIEKTMEIDKGRGVDGFIEWTKKNPKEASNLIRNWIEEE